MQKVTMSYDCHSPRGTEFVTRLCLGLSHLREHEFKHSFQDSLNPICSYGCDAELTSLFFLYFLTFATERTIHLSTLKDIDQKQ